MRNKWRPRERELTHSTCSTGGKREKRMEREKGEGRGLFRKRPRAKAGRSEQQNETAAALFFEVSRASCSLVFFSRAFLPQRPTPEVRIRCQLSNEPLRSWIGTEENSRATRANAEIEARFEPSKKRRFFFSFFFFLHFRPLSKPLDPPQKNKTLKTQRRGGQGL